MAVPIKIFISYSKKDQDIVRKIAKILEKNQIGY
jgi:hypothetical protein